MVTIIFESHGTTLDNEQKLASGRYDVALSPLGEKQAYELGVRHKNEHFDAIFVSNLQRSYKTAEIAFAGRDFQIVKDARLTECDYGDFTRLPSSKIETRRVEFVDKPFPKGESYLQTSVRMKIFLQDLLKNYTGKKVMIVGHRATQYGLEHWINGVPFKDAVTAPWYWQPGWTYFLHNLSAH